MENIGGNKISFSSFQVHSNKTVTEQLLSPNFRACV